jgi:beta-galactosidase
MNRKTLKGINQICGLLALIPALSLSAQRSEQVLTDNWQFSKGENAEQWQAVRVPHDWAIYGPFGREYDLQTVAVEQNGETEKTEKTGRTGGLPYYGKGEYRTTFNVADTVGRHFTVLFDGAMSNARVWVNDTEIGRWAYGYNSFSLNADGAVRPGSNTLHVTLENKPESSRWYPGAGLYRNVHLIATNKIHIPVWGTYITTPHVEADYATVNLKINIEGAAKGQVVDVVTEIVDDAGTVVAQNRSHHATHGQPETQNFIVNTPALWSPESPRLYTANTRLIVDGQEVDSYATRFGIRSLEYIPSKGFFLNGVYTKFKGVCNHHDLGPLGAAVNRSALRHQLEMLKDMGANAIRTSHNMPAPELVELCDEMGLMLMVEPFDDWSFRPKCPNGYGSIFNEWAERDMVNMLHHYRNNPSVVLWSIGNEVPSQWGPDGVSELTFLQDIVHREDPTRPVTCGMDQIGSVLDNGFAASLDIPGFNYKPQHYRRAYEMLPQRLVLGTETASTVSSRGVYKFPAEAKSQAMYPDNQSSSYDTEYCYWSNLPDIDFASDDDLPWMIGQFVWTGFDYLGEPTPYDTDAWPSHSSLFGIIDLASLPKDRYYLYRSVWNTADATLHILPHWTWPGREGAVTPVMVYTSYPKAELFINGKSQGIQEKAAAQSAQSSQDSQNSRASQFSTNRDCGSNDMARYRLMWMNTTYEPGELKVVAYDANGNEAATETVRTAGKAHHLVLSCNRNSLTADGNDLAYITVQVADKDGNIVPTDSRLVKFEVSGNGSFEATANGDATSLMPFQEPQMRLFSGAATAIVRSSATAGTLTFRAKASGVKSATLTLPIR